MCPRQWPFREGSAGCVGWIRRRRRCGRGFPWSQPASQQGFGQRHSGAWIVHYSDAQRSLFEKGFGVHNIHAPIITGWLAGEYKTAMKVICRIPSVMNRLGAPASRHRVRMSVLDWPADASNPRDCVLVQGFKAHKRFPVILIPAFSALRRKMPPGARRRGSGRQGFNF